MKLLLDTNVVVWLLLGRRDAIPETVSDEIANPDNSPLVSAASVWEIAVKRSLGKLELPPRWRSTLSLLDLDHLPVTAEHAAGVEDLPWLHRDPFDRLLVAQARAEDALLVTADARLAGYGPVLWA